MLVALHQAVWPGWLDGGGGEHALTRYKNFSNPQLVIVGPFSLGIPVKVNIDSRGKPNGVPERR